MNNKELQDLEDVTMTKVLGGQFIGHVKFWVLMGSIIIGAVSLCKAAVLLQDSVNLFFK